jgi:hypothetical protein
LNSRVTYREPKGGVKAAPNVEHANYSRAPSRSFCLAGETILDEVPEEAPEEAQKELQKSQKKLQKRLQKKPDENTTRARREAPAAGNLCTLTDLATRC